jgi:hypothetical protein
MQAGGTLYGSVNVIPAVLGGLPQGSEPAVPGDSRYGSGRVRVPFF